MPVYRGSRSCSPVVIASLRRDTRSSLPGIVSIIEVMQQVVSQPGAGIFPQSKLSTVEIDRTGARRRQVATLLEVDVTHARRQIRLTNRGGESAVSFIAWLVGSVARTLSDHPDARPEMPGRRRMRRGTVTVSLLVDRSVGDHRTAMPVVIQDAETRSVGDIESMIHRARVEPVDVAAFIVGRSTGPAAAIYRSLPSFVRRGLLNRAVRNRRRLDRISGNIVISPSGMGGRVKGWFIPASRHPMCIGIGAVTPKAVVVNGTIQPREVFHMTVLVDNSVIGRRSVSRWISQLLRTMENAREFHLN